MFDKSEMDQVLLATGGYDHTIKLWHTHSGICYRTMQHSESVKFLTFVLQ
jgi:G protein beta subunit-like protein